MRRVAVVFAVLAALVVPGTAAAHVVRGAPVATDFSARIRGLVPPADAVRAVVVDGDRQLSLTVAPSAQVAIPGALGEPLLRFTPAGVFVNRRSLTAQSDRVAPGALRPVANPQAPPLWHRLTTGHTYRWHEHRLHALEPLAARRASEAELGRWAVPLLIDGRRHALIGTLRYRPPGATWAWIGGACGLAILVCALVAAARPAWQGATVAVAVAAVVLTGTIRIARELYGRPDLAASNFLAIAFTTAVGAALLWALLRGPGGVPLFTACLVGIGSLFQGIAFAPMVTHGYALTVLPTAAARAGVTSILGLGAGLLAVTLWAQFGPERAAA
ncbi:MAG TPA: hypothetical protein VFU10_00485 [Gaiellaceae bacterium]|nr:hypothetical protein [Gaiellaceae bacterium]